MLVLLCACGESDGRPPSAGNTAVRVEWPFPVHPNRVESHTCCGESVEHCLDDLLSGEVEPVIVHPPDSELSEPSNVTEVFMDLPDGLRCATAFYVDCGGGISCTASQTFEVPTEVPARVDIVSVCNPFSSEQADACQRTR